MTINDDLVEQLRATNAFYPLKAADAIEALAKHIAELEEALEFYAWADHWETEPNRMSVCAEDKGKRARAALEKSNGNG